MLGPIIAGVLLVIAIAVFFVYRSLTAKRTLVTKIAGAIGGQLGWRYSSIDRLLKEAGDSGIGGQTATAVKAAKSEAIRAAEQLARAPESEASVKGLSNAEQKLRQALRDLVLAVEDTKTSGTASQALDARISDLAASDTELKGACGTYNNAVDEYNKALDHPMLGLFGRLFGMKKAAPLEVRQPASKLGAYGRRRTSGSRPVVS
jgi:hypothetical protein